MALGDITYQKNLTGAVKLLHNQATANSKPSGATAGADITGIYPTRPLREGTIVIKGTGTDTLLGTFRLWGYSGDADDWFPLGTGTDGDKGKLNEGAELGETSTDKIQHAEAVEFAGHFTRLYLELIGPGGTAPSFNAWFIAPRIVTY